MINLLSEAIALGSLLSSQSFNTFRGPTGTCALGAAQEAIGARTFQVVLERWPWLSTENAVCPECGYTGPSGIVLGLCLNDLHHWSRERIAEFCAGIEPKPTPPLDNYEEYVEVL